MQRNQIKNGTKVMVAGEGSEYYPAIVIDDKLTRTNTQILYAPVKDPDFVKVKDCSGLEYETHWSNCNNFLTRLLSEE